jgi:chromatin structure-remodeling complex subunit SFH1
MPMNGPQRLPAQNAAHYVPQPLSHRVVIPTVPQALWSSYASRVRTGTTLLIQPISSASQGPLGATPSGSFTPGSGAGRSTRGRGAAVNYAEAGSGDEFEEQPMEKPAPTGPLDSDDSDFQASGGTRTTIRKMGRGPGSNAVLNAKLTAAAAAAYKDQNESHLGSVPPIHLLRPNPVHHVKLEHQSVTFLMSFSIY